MEKSCLNDTAQLMDFATESTIMPTVFGGSS